MPLLIEIPEILKAKTPKINYHKFKNYDIKY